MHVRKRNEMKEFSVQTLFTCCDVLFAITTGLEGNSHIAVDFDIFF